MTHKLSTLLYVEDDADIAEVTKMTLEHFGNYTVHHCISGFQALDDYPKVDPQLIMMDVMMPRMDGIETLAQLKDRIGPSLAPVVFMTAKAQVHEQANYRELGALGVIVKPFDPMTLCDQVQALWEAHNGE